MDGYQCVEEAIQFSANGGAQRSLLIHIHKRARRYDATLPQHTGTSVMMALQIRKGGGGRSLTLGMCVYV